MSRSLSKASTWPSLVSSILRSTSFSTRSSKFAGSSNCSENVSVDVGHYATWNVEVKAKIYNLLTLHRGYYESNALKAPKNDDAAVVATAGKHLPKAA